MRLPGRRMSGASKRRLQPKTQGGKVARYFAAGWEAGISVRWGDLTAEERTALKRMNRGAYPGLAADLGERLMALGLAVRRPNGIGISRVGREMVINALLAGRQAVDE